MEIKTIGVVGAGTMGNGIAQVAAQSGYNVIMSDIDDKYVQNALKNIDKFMAKSVEKGKITAESKAATLGRIKGTTKIEDMKDADYVVEVVLEEMPLKKKVFAQLDEITKPECIITSTRPRCRSRRSRPRRRSPTRFAACTSSTRFPS
jgi:3-hydroxybutyryl-CoA dehydrogenase